MCPHQTEILGPPPPLQIPGSTAVWEMFLSIAIGEPAECHALEEAGSGARATRLALSAETQFD